MLKFTMSTLCLLLETSRKFLEWMTKIKNFGTYLGNQCLFLFILLLVFLSGTNMFIY